jgi:hypothetical protein
MVQILVIQSARYNAMTLPQSDPSYIDTRSLTKITVILEELYTKFIESIARLRV